MKPMLRLLLTLLSLLLSLNEATAQNAPAVPGGAREFKDMLKGFPSKEFLKLRGNTKVETSMEMSKQITAKELGKEGTYRGKVTKIEVWPFPERGITGWRLAVEDDLKQGSMTINVWAWVYVHTDPNGVIPKIKVGKEVTVTGKVNRADLSVTEAPRLNIDLIVTAMTAQK